ncbi:MAG: hypothetical protein ACK5RG_13920 [Cyclobacteriaceae bacterium]|jgi:erythromycin esterase
MNKILTLLLVFTWGASSSQTKFNSTIEFTDDLTKFQSLSNFKNTLQNVEIMALGENTHGLGEVFTAKIELVKFLHEKLGFDLILFESGYGDAAMAWEKLDALSAKEFTSIFSSNFYYNSEEIEKLVDYVKSKEGKLKIQGFDCQPQQNYLIKRMTEIAQRIDSILAKSVAVEMKKFNNLYQFENDKDTISFNKQRDNFINFLHKYNDFVIKTILNY